MDDDGVDEELLGELADVSESPTLLVACGFDGALAEPTDDPDGARAEQQSSEALNVLLALPGTTVAVVSRRPADEVAELMFLSGAKGGLRVVAPEDLGPLRPDGASMVVVDADPASFASARDGDLVVAVGEYEHGRDGRFRIADAQDVVEVLEELADLRRHR
jgi:hypothetical protein